MSITVYQRSYAAMVVDEREVMRYAGARGGEDELRPLLDECLRESERVLTYNVCYCELPVSRSDDGIRLGSIFTASSNLLVNLRGCDSVVLFAATVGIGIDRLIAKYSRLSPARALILDAIGVERVESLCDAFNAEIRAEVEQSGGFVRPRFSPGYGDLPLTLQTDIFRLLDCPKRLGLTLNESLLMSPTKSVTAIIGIGR